METDDLRRAIESAFEQLPIPDPGSLFDRTSASAKGLREEDLTRLAGSPIYEQVKVLIKGDLGEFVGRPWQDVDREMIERNLYGFWRLRPGAYQYYLPAQLLAALSEDAADKPGSLMYSTARSLRPDFWYLYYREPDPKLRERQQLFTDAQYRVVAAFLGKAFEGDAPDRYRAMQALYWGWNRMDTPELAAATAYYRSLRSHTYPVPDDPAVATLFREIESAFAETPYPGDDDICDEDGFKDPDFAEYATEFRGVKWQQMHPELLARSDASLSYFTAGAFRYFLPAALLSDLSHYESNEDPVFHLTYGFDNPEEDPAMLLYRERRFSGFTEPERKAIISYLRYQAVTDMYEAPAIHIALERYWRPSLRAC